MRPNSQLYSSATSREQAAVLFALAAKMIRLSLDLDSVCTVRDTIKQIYCPELGTLYRALSSEAKTAHGLSPSLIIHDELGQVKGPRSPLYEALETATSAQTNPLSIVISTQAPTDADLLSVLIDDAKSGADPRTVLVVYTAPVDLDPFSDKAIKAANPAFGDFQNPVEIRGMAEDARRMNSREAEYRNLVLNQRVDMAAPFVGSVAWAACGSAPADFHGLPIFAGLDLAEVADLAAFVPIAPKDGLWHCRPTFWLPEVGLREKSRIDRVAYDLWHDQGYLETTPGKTISYAFIAEYLWRFCMEYDVRTIAFDRWGWKHLMPWLQKAGFPDYMLEGDQAIFKPMGQGYESMSPALNDLENLLLNGKLRHGMHPVLEMCARNATVTFDEQRNRKMSKRISHGRIDGMVALAMAASVAGTWQMQPKLDISAMIG
jgi:phage terminase large subunit-like protein